MHGVNAKKEYLLKIKSLNEIALSEHEKESLQDECAHYYTKCQSLKNDNKYFLELCGEFCDKLNDSVKEAKSLKDEL